MNLKYGRSVFPWWWIAVLLHFITLGQKHHVHVHVLKILSASHTCMCCSTHSGIHTLCNVYLSPSPKYAIGVYIIMLQRSWEHLFSKIMNFCASPRPQQFQLINSKFTVICFFIFCQCSVRWMGMASSGQRTLTMRAMKTSWRATCPSWHIISVISIPLFYMIQ